MQAWSGLCTIKPSAGTGSLNARVKILLILIQIRNHDERVLEGRAQKTVHNDGPACCTAYIYQADVSDSKSEFSNHITLIWPQYLLLYNNIFFAPFWFMKLTWSLSANTPYKKQTDVYWTPRNYASILNFFCSPIFINQSSLCKHMKIALLPPL